ncbi:glycosyltransferase family A protein [Mycobacterium neglectum]|uniref:glycosyltransferase family A protein n=1 Tax=Mycobacterium neglectum TaxID=242737 RepID=UPI000BFEBD55|nr:glycosyltransferase family 2 protein [Mycobacterium neglectum]
MLRTNAEVDLDAAPFVSFLTTAYRTEHIVGETIQSVLAQCRRDWELIVVDNGNSDEMARVVGQYLSDPRITLIRQENKGYIGGISAAAAAARGRFVCVLDSDDLVEPTFSERAGALIDACPEIDAVGCDAIVFKDPDDGEKPDEFFASTGRKVRPDPTRPATFHELLDEGAPPYIGIIRRAAWDTLGGYVSSPDIEPDVVLWLRLAATGRDVRILADPLIRTRIRGDSLSNDPANLDVFQKRMQQSYLLVGREYGMSESALSAHGMLRRLRYHRSLGTARLALINGDVRGARAAARDAFRQQHTPRAAAVVFGLYVSRGLMVSIHPVKNRIASAVRRGRHRIARRLRRQGELQAGRKDRQ